MDNIYWLIDKLPIPFILHQKNKILHANDAFKKFLTDEQNIESLELRSWLTAVIKIKEHCDLVINNMDINEETTVTTEGFVKGVARYWNIVSFPFPEKLSEKIYITYLQDISNLHDKKSYWDLHLRVSKATMQLIKEMAERKKLELKAADLNSQLITTARRAGMADIATSVLHNVGNVLNSVKVSTGLLNQNINQSDFHNLIKITEMLKEHLADPSTYFTEDPKGKLIPDYLTALAKSLTKAHEKSSQEMKNLLKYIQHIEDIVAMQVNTSGAVKMSEKISLSETLDTAIQLCGNSFKNRHIEIQKKYGDNLFLISDKFKIIQILVNLLQNSAEALLSPDIDVPVKIISIKIEKEEKNITISISDNGVGIAPENITKIFALGFTTKKDGHGFGLHGSALSATELDGSLHAKSNGIGLGATFILTLPIGINEK